MKKPVRYALAVIAGAVAASLLVFGIEVIGHSVYPAFAEQHVLFSSTRM